MKIKVLLKLDEQLRDFKNEEKGLQQCQRSLILCQYQPISIIFSDSSFKTISICLLVIQPFSRRIFPMCLYGFFEELSSTCSTKASLICFSVANSKYTAIFANYGQYFFENVLLIPFPQRHVWQPPFSQWHVWLSPTNSLDWFRFISSTTDKPSNFVLTISNFSYLKN